MPRLMETGPEPSFDSRVEEVVRRMLTGGELARLVGPANADATAQDHGSGLGIQNVRRGVLALTVAPPANLGIPIGAGWTALPIGGKLSLSGRPLLVCVQAIGAAGPSVGAELNLSATVRGEEVTGAVNGMPGAHTSAHDPTGITGWHVIPRPLAGPAEVGMVATADIAGGIVYGGTGVNLLALLAVEL